MTIAVTTPTGHVGAHVVRMLLRAGVRPRVLCRDATRLDRRVRPHVDALEGDQLDQDWVVEATRDVDALFWVAPAGTGGDPVAAYQRLGEVAAVAAQTNAITRVVFQSSGGAEQRGGLGEIDGLGLAEEALDAADTSVVHLRCGYFFSNLFDLPLADGVLPTAFPLDLAQPWVAPRDVAEVATGRLLSTEWDSSTVQAVHGPEDLTFEAAAAILSRASGRDVKAVAIGLDDFADALRKAGLPEEQVAGYVEMTRGISAGFTPEDPRDVRTTTSTTLAAWAVDHLDELGLGLAVPYECPATACGT